ncbi:MAG: winged helix-turn-helix domain-containing protein, partial [Bryobacteraceae bacterium]
MRDPASPPEKEPSRRQYWFGEFTLDLDAGLLRRGAQEVTLRSKPFEVLVYLVEHHGRLVPKTALLDAVWPDAVVTDNSLAQCLLEIRRALGDESQRLIRTIKRRGYMFAAPVTTSAMKIQDQAVAVSTDSAPSSQPALVPAWTSRNRLLAAGFAVSLLMAIGALLISWPTAPIEQKRVPAWEQITNFPDSAVSPALSPDGRMLAFIRSSEWFLTPDPIYIKMLPDGEPVQLTNDPRWKYGLSFSPDSSQIAYTVSERGPLGWKTYTMSVLGGEPKLLLPNSSGVTWLGRGRLLFSEIRAGEHMGLVTATASRSEYRKIYFPKNERGMVHLAYPSPDRRWALALEMDPVWHPCRLLPLDGSSEGWEVGPRGKCTSAAWSPDGKWMYFGVEVQGKHHLWRQRFMNGKPEQLTFGATEEDGVAVAPDGRSLITSVGLEHSVLWIHDQQGDRPISSEGYVVSRPGWSTSVKFSPDGKYLFYLMRRQSTESPSELWRTDLESGTTERILPEFSVIGYDIAPPGQQIVFSTKASGDGAEIWFAWLDGSSPPKRIGSTYGPTEYAGPYFGPDN